MNNNHLGLGNLMKYQLSMIKWSWANSSNLTHPFLSTILLTSSLIGAFIYFYKTSKRTTTHRSITNGNGHRVPAMVNLGNTCYANSLLQGLASSKAFLKWIQVIDTKLACENHKLMFLDALKRIIQELNDFTKERCSASDVIDALLAHRWSIPPNTEQDLYELFNVFVTTWDEELATLRSNRYSPLQKIVEIEEEEKTLSNQPSSMNITRRNVAAGSSTFAKGDNVDKVHEELPAINTNSYSILNPRPQSLSERSFEHVKNAVADEKLLKPPCIGLLAVQLSCCRENCSYKKIREEKFCVLSLSLPKSPDPMLTFSKLLRKYFTAEYIQGASCDRCVERKRQPSGGLMKKQGFCKLPPLLIFRIERVGFSSNGNVFKRTERFLFSEFIDVREYCFFANEQNKPRQLKGSLSNPYFRVLGGSASNTMSSFSVDVKTEQQQAAQLSSTRSATNFGDYENLFKYKYQLRAVSVHIGHAHSGHFITYRRGIDAQNRTAWYRTSDTEVTLVSFNEVASSEAYMLFYDRTLSSLK